LRGVRGCGAAATLSGVYQCLHQEKPDEQTFEGMLLIDPERKLMLRRSRTIEIRMSEITFPPFKLMGAAGNDPRPTVVNGCRGATPLQFAALPQFASAGPSSYIDDKIAG
jgi:hypothetical protein